jgi:drug/metabolite transporter (DMT)-like permease
MSLIWGLPYLFIKVAVDDGVSPAFLSFARCVIAAVVLLALAWKAGVVGQIRTAWRWVAVYALVEVALPFPLIAAGEQRVSSSLAAILIACVPLLVALLAIRVDASERPTGVRLVGLLVGLAGVVALVGIDVAGKTDELIGTGLIVLAAVGYAVGPMVLKMKLPGLDARAMMGGSLAIASVMLAIPAAFTVPTEVPSADALASIVVLGLVCTALAFVVFSALIREVGPGKALVFTYVNPVVAVALGVLILDERPGAGAVAGLLLILAGSWLSTDGRLPPGVSRRLGAVSTPASQPAANRSGIAEVAA